MNYTPLIIQKLKELNETADEFTFGEILYSFLRNSILKKSPNNISIGWLKGIDDKDFYVAIEKAIDEEIEFKKDIK